MCNYLNYKKSNKNLTNDELKLLEKYKISYL